MKVIDLLNRIANGEEVPKKIRIGDKIDIFYYQDYIKSYKAYDNEYLMCEYLCNTDRLNDEVEILNDEIEVIGKDKKIRKIKVDYSPDIEEKIFYEDGDKPRHCILRDAGTELLIDKINEIIDYINGGTNGK